MILPNICFAEDLINIEDLISREDTNNKIEKDKVNKLLNNTKNQINEMIKQNVKNDEVVNFDMIDAYKVYNLLEPDIVKEYKKSGNLENIISDNYIWRIPTKNKNGENNFIVSVKKDNTKKDEWVMTGISNKAKTKDSFEINNRKSLNSILQKAEIQKASRLQYIESYMYHTTFAYINKKGEEYLISYGSRPDLTGLENGKLYKINDAITILDKNFNETSNQSENNAGAKNSVQFTIYQQVIPIIAIFLVLCIIGFIMFRKRMSCS